MSKFWKFMNKTVSDEAGQPKQVNVLRIDGPIDTEIWWGDEITPDAFREELEAHPGDIEVYINSPGGNIIAASQIYTMLVEHKGNVVVKIEGLAASAASIIAMAGTTVLMAPVAYMMIHGASTVAWGNQQEMRHEADVLAEIDKGIRDAYCLKTGLRESKVAQMMEDETWMSAKTCISLGFADGYIGQDVQETETEDEPDEPKDSAVVEKNSMPAVAWTGRQQFAAILKAAGIVNPSDLVERMIASRSEPKPDSSTESEAKPNDEIEETKQSEPETIPEATTKAIAAQQFYDRLNAIKNKF